MRSEDEGEEVKSDEVVVKKLPCLIVIVQPTKSRRAGTCMSVPAKLSILSIQGQH